MPHYVGAPLAGALYRYAADQHKSGFALSEIIPHNLGGHNLRSNRGARLCQFMVGSGLVFLSGEIPREYWKGVTNCFQLPGAPTPRSAALETGTPARMRLRCDSAQRTPAPWAESKC